MDDNGSRDLELVVKAPDAKGVEVGTRFPVPDPDEKFSG